MSTERNPPSSQVSQSTDAQSITRWIHSLKAGDSRANEEIWQRYYARVVELARSKLQAKLRRVADEEDVAIEALNSFFKGVSEQRFPKLNDRDDLWRLLFTITERRAIRVANHERRQKRGGGDVRGQSIFENPDSPGQDGLQAHAACPQPTPDAAVEITESLRALLGQLDDQLLIDIAIRKLEGFSVEEISQLHDVSVRTVKRKLQRIRTIWSEHES